MSQVMVERKPLGAVARMGVVAGMHVAIIYVVANSLGLVPSLVTPAPIILTDTPEPVVVEDRPVVVDYRPQDPMINVVEPEQLPPIADEPRDDTIVARALPPDGLPDTSVSRTVRETVLGVRSDARHPLTQPAYPASMIRGNNEGVVDVEVFVQPNGRVADARIVKSSGFEAFDRATMEEARRRWRLLPASRDGVPYAQWHTVRVVFKLENR